MIALALTRVDVADYVSALFIVYIILILANILISYVPRMPYNRGCARCSTSSPRRPTPTSTSSVASCRRSAAAASRSTSARSSAIIVLAVAQALLVGLIAG